MSSFFRTIGTCLMAGAASLACSAGPLPEVGSNETGVAEPETVASVEQRVDQACINQCMAGCICTPADGKPAQCRKLCLADCNETCACTPSCAGKACGAPDGCGGQCTTGSCPSGQTCGGGGVQSQCGCTPNCAGKACGAANGCGGVCSAGACASGQTCGGGGVPNQCGCTPNCAGKTCGAADGCGGRCLSGSCPGGAICGDGGSPGLCGLPNLNGSVTGTLLPSPYLVKYARYNVVVRNMGPVDANGVDLLFWTNLPARINTSSMPPGFVCRTLEEYLPRLGLRCTGQRIPRFDTANLQFEVALLNSGYNVFALFADPDNTMVELDESDNLANGGVQVP